MFHCTDTQAVCRGCGRALEGAPYFKGGAAYIPAPTGQPSHRMTPAKRCFYGGWVCSRECDIRACLELERSMPGHGVGSSLAPQTAAHIRRKWDEAA